MFRASKKFGQYNGKQRFLFLLLHIMPHNLIPNSLTIQYNSVTASVNAVNDQIIGTLFYLLFVIFLNTCDDFVYCCSLHLIHDGFCSPIICAKFT